MTPQEAERLLDEYENDLRLVGSYPTISRENRIKAFRAKLLAALTTESPEPEGSRKGPVFINKYPSPEEPQPEPEPDAICVCGHPALYHRRGHMDGPRLDCDECARPFSTSNCSGFLARQPESGEQESVEAWRQQQARESIQKWLYMLRETVPMQTDENGRVSIHAVTLTGLVGDLEALASPPMPPPSPEALEALKWAVEHCDNEATHSLRYQDAWRARAAALRTLTHADAE